MKTTRLTRRGLGRGLLGAASATFATGILGQPAKAAEFDFKLGVKYVGNPLLDDPAEPVTFANVLLREQTCCFSSRAGCRFGSSAPPG